MSAILQSPHWAFIGWLIVIAIFFYIVHAAAKSERPAKTFLFHMLSFSGIEGAILLGLWAAIAKSDQWRDELDREDAAAMEDKNGSDN